MTTCSTSSRSTPCRVSAAKSTELTPGRSGPVTVMRTLVCATGLAGLGVVARLRLRADRLADLLARVGVLADVRLRAELLHQVRVVQLERRALRADAGQLGEVV